MSENYFDDLHVEFVGHFCFLRDGIFRKRDKLRIGLMTGKNVVKVTKHGEHATVCPILFFDYPDEEYQWRVLDQAKRESYFFDISGARADRIQATLQKDFPQGFSKCHDPIPFRMILDDMNESFHNYRAQRCYRLPMFVEQFLTQIYVDHVMALSKNKYEAVIHGMADEIYKSPGSAFDFAQRARQMGLTFIHFRRIFKSVIGLPPHKYQQKCRLAYAVGLLKKSKELQIQQIADLCGFGNSSEFSRFFKKQTGLSPLNYCQMFSE